MKKSLLIVLLFIFWLALSGAIENEQPDFSREERLKKATELYISGKIYLQDNDYDRANDAFKKAQELLNAGALADISGNGLTDYMRNIDTQPLAVKNGSAVAKKPAAKPLGLRFKKANESYNRGIEAIQRQEYNQAEASLKESIRFNPKDKDAYYNLGVLYENYFADQKNALDCYQRYVRLAGQAENVKEVRSWIKDIKKGMTPDD